MKRIRFSLRFVLVVTTVVAGACYVLVLPTLYAQRFVAAVRAADYQLADGYFHDSDDRCLADWNKNSHQFQVQADMEPWSLRDFVRGRRLVKLVVTYGGPRPTQSRTGTISATPVGLLSPQITGGFGGGGNFDVPLTPQVPTA